MVYSHSIRHYARILTCILIVVAAYSSDSIAKESTSTLSGHVVYTDGKPVPLLQLAVKPVKFERGNEIGQRKPIQSWSKATTDDKGFFSIENIDTGTSRLVMFPDHGSDYEIVSIQMGDLTIHSTAFLSHFPVWFGKITFGIVQDTRISDVVVKVKKPRMRVSGRILLPDGSPLINAEFELYVHHRRGNNPIYALSTSTSSGSTGGAFKTDSEGSFVSYFPDETGEHLVHINFKGAIARTGWFHLDEGKQKDGLVLKLNNLDKIRTRRNNREKARQAVWVVNPKNMHAYKKIECESFEDAIEKAKSAGAYLVAINDDMEQRWLEAAFPIKDFFWIGLSLPESATTWKWRNGQPLTFTNWLTRKPDYVSVHKGKAAFALEFSSKKWTTIDVDSPIRQVVKQAIIEKEDFTDKNNLRK